IPTSFQKAVGATHFFTDPRIAEEFNSYIPKTTEARATNDLFRTIDNWRWLLQKTTLFGSPLYALATANRNLFGHGYFSALRGAVSNYGMVGSIQMAKVFMFRDALMKAGKWKEAKAGLPPDL